MFKNLTDFSYERDWKGALGFYFAYGFLGLLATLLVGGIIVAPYVSQGATYDQGYDVGRMVGSVLAPMYCLAIACLLLVKKKSYKNFGYIVLGVLSGVLGLFGGIVLGLIIPAIMTTKGRGNAKAG